MKTPARKTITIIVEAARLVYLNRLRIKNFSNKKPKLFLNQSLYPYYRMLYGKVKELAREGLVDSFWISNGTIKMKELLES